MANITKKLTEHLSSYGYIIHDNYENVKQDDVIIMDDLVLFIQNGKCIISFKATLTPNEAVNYILIISQIINPENIDTVESFIYTEDKQLLKGDEAFTFIENTKEKGIITKFSNELTYRQMLREIDEDKCFKC